MEPNTEQREILLAEDNLPYADILQQRLRAIPFPYHLSLVSDGEALSTCRAPLLHGKVAAWTHCPPPPHSKNHGFPVEIISRAVWLYFRLCLSLREVQAILLARGVSVTYEAIRKWGRKFGQPYANQLRRRRPRPGDKWHMAEVFLTIKGEPHYLWRAGDQDGNVLEILVQRRRDKRAAKKFFRTLLKGLPYVPRVTVTDNLKSYGAAKQELLPGGEHRQHRYLNNRAENSHQPTRQRERRLPRFKSPGHAQRFLAASGPIAQHFRLRRHRLSAPAYRQEMRTRFQSWQEITTPAIAA